MRRKAKPFGFINAAIWGLVIGYGAAACNDAFSQQRLPVPIQPGQIPAAYCWDVAGTNYPTRQCDNGLWEVSQPDGLYLTGIGPLPSEYQPPPADNVGPPAAAMFAPNFLFGGGASAMPPGVR